MISTSLLTSVRVIAHVSAGPLGPVLVIGYFLVTVLIAVLALRLRSEERYQLDDDKDRG